MGTDDSVQGSHERTGEQPERRQPRSTGPSVPRAGGGLARPPPPGGPPRAAPRVPGVRAPAAERGVQPGGRAAVADDRDRALRARARPQQAVQHRARHRGDPLPPLARPRRPRPRRRAHGRRLRRRELLALRVPEPAPLSHGVGRRQPHRARPRPGGVLPRPPPGQGPLRALRRLRRTDPAARAGVGRPRGVLRLLPPRPEPGRDPRGVVPRPSARRPGGDGRAGRGPRGGRALPVRDQPLRGARERPRPRRPLRPRAPGRLRSLPDEAVPRRPGHHARGRRLPSADGRRPQRLSDAPPGGRAFASSTWWPS